MQYFTCLSCLNRIGLYNLKINSIEDLKCKALKNVLEAGSLKNVL